MTPALLEGQGLVAVRSRRARVGQLRVLRHPRRADLWLVKRVSDVLADGRMRVASDNADTTTTDSRTFGAVEVRGTYRVVAVVGRGRGEVRSPR